MPKSDGRHPEPQYMNVAAVRYWVCDSFYIVTNHIFRVFQDVMNPE